MNDRINEWNWNQVMDLKGLTIADGLLQVGADVEMQEAFEGAMDFLWHGSDGLPMHGRCLVQPSICQLMCST